MSRTPSATCAALEDRRGEAEVADPAVRAASRRRRRRPSGRGSPGPGRRSMYSSACSSARRAAGSAWSSGEGTRRGDRDAHARVRAVGDHRLEGVRVDRDRPVVGRAVVGRQRPPAGDGGVPVGAVRRVAAGPSTYSNVVSSGAISPARAPPSMLMLQIVIRCSIVRARMASPVYSKTWPVPPPIPIRAISARMMSLARHAGGEPAVDADLVGLRVALEQRLGREDHLDLARPDPERERTERAVGRRVRVAADDRHARLGQAELRPDDVDDPLARASRARGAGSRTRRSSARAGGPGPRPSGRAIGRLRAWSGSSGRRSRRSAPGGGPSGRGRAAR